MVIDRSKHNKYSVNQVYTPSSTAQTEQQTAQSESSQTIFLRPGAQVNQNAFSTVQVSDGSITNEITAQNPSDTIKFTYVSPIKISLIDGNIQISYEDNGALWKLDEDGNLWTDRNVYSTKEISAYGFSEEGSPSGGANYLYELSDVDSATATSPIDNGILQYNAVKKKWVVTDGSGIKPDLTDYTTKQYVTEQINLLVGTAPDVLDTIYEIAEALNNDPDYVKDIANNLSNLTNRVVKLEDMFEWDNGKIKAKADLYGVGEISAYGYSSGSPSSGAQYLSELLDVDLTNLADQCILQYNSITKKWEATDGSNIKPDLSAYATQTWVTQKIQTATESLRNEFNSEISEIKQDIVSINDALDLLNKMFEWDGDNIKAKANLYSVGEISAYGYQDGSAGSGAQYLHELLDVTLTELTSGQLLQWDGSKWVNINKDEVGLNESELQQYLTENNYAKKSDIPKTISWTNITNKPSWITNEKPTYSWTDITNKPTVFTTNIGNISDLNSSWDSLLKNKPTAYITRWPSFSEVTNKPTTLSGYGITDGVNSITLTGSGNAVTSASINGHVITLTKGSTFSLSTHNHDSVYVNVAGDTMTGTLTLPTIVVNTRIQLGNAYIEYDSTNNAVVIKNKTTSEVINLYATGEVSAYGYSDETNPSGAMYLSELKDVKLTSIAENDMLVWNGSVWVNTPMADITPELNVDNITDLNASWRTLLKSAPSAYVTRWPTISEVTNKQSLIIKLNSGTTEGTNLFTYNVTTAKTVNITPSAIGAAASNHNHSWSNITSGKPTTLSGYGITDGVNAVSVTGSGNAITAASVSGHTLALTKGSTFLLSSAYTATDVLAKLKTVDGGGSGLDADTLDEFHAISLTRSYTHSSHNVYMCLGTLVIPQNGYTARLYLISGYGYNAVESQSRIGMILIRTSNGVANNGKYYTGHVEAYRYGIYNIYVVQNSSTSFTLWTDKTSYTGSGYISIDNSSGVTFTKSSETSSSLPFEAALLNKYQVAYTDSNVASATKLQTPRTIWGQSFDGTNNISRTLIISGGTHGNYDEGIRIHPNNGWATILLGGSDLSSNIGTSPNSWSIHNNNGNFFINRNGANTNTGYQLCNIGGNWGFGTTSPSYKLHVAGTMYATGATKLASTLSVTGLITASAGLTTPQYIQIGSGRIYWDSTNKALYVKSSDGSSAVNFYATGEVSAYGAGSGGSSGGGVSYLHELSDVTISNQKTDDMLKWNGSKWINVPMSDIKPDLTDYVTKDGTGAQGIWNISISGTASLASSVAWANVTSKPTTLSGYGITDAVTIGTTQIITGTKTLTGTLTVCTTGTDNYNQGIRINRTALNQWATLTIGCVGAGTAGTSANTWLIGTPSNSNSLIFNLNNYSELVGLCLKGHGNNDMKWNNNTVFHAGNYTSTLDTRYVKKAGDTMTGPLTITSTVINNFDEGLRISLASNGWAGITFGSTGTSGAPTNGWFAARNNTNQFIISPGGSSNTTGLTLNSGGNILWRNNIILDTVNYTSYLDNRYVNVTGDTMTGTLYMPHSLVGISEADANKYAGSNTYYNLAVGWKEPNHGLSILLYRPDSTKQAGLGFSTTNADHAALSLQANSNDLYLTNRKGGVVINALKNNVYPLTLRGGSTFSVINIQNSSGTAVTDIGWLNDSRGNSAYMANISSNGAVTVANDGLWYSDNANTFRKYKVWHAGNGGSGSGLDADLLDGYHGNDSAVASTYVLRDSNIRIAANSLRYNAHNATPSGTAIGWYRIFTFSRSNNSAGDSVIIHLGRSYNSPNNEGYVFAITLAYNGGISITQLAGYANNRLITKIRVDYTNNGTAYVDFYLGVSSNYNNTYFVYGSGAGTFQNPVLVSSASGTTYEFETTNGCKSSRGFAGSLNGNATSATKLQTPRTIWGQSFDGTRNVSGALTGVTSITASGQISTTVSTSPSFYANIAAGSWAFIRLKSGTPLWDIAVRDTDNNGALQFRYDGGTAQMLITTSGNVGIGTTSPSYKLHVSGAIYSTSEIISSSANAFRAAYGNYGFFIRNDGENTYFMLTNSGNAYGSWSNLRPLYINNSTGLVRFGQGISVSGVSSFGSTLNVAGAVAMSSTLSVASTSTFTGRTTHNGGIDSNNSIVSYYSGPAFLAKTNSGNWAFLRLSCADNPMWDVATINNTHTKIQQAGAFEIRDQLDGSCGISIRRGTSSYGKLVVTSSSTESSIGYCNSTSGYVTPMWTVGVGIGGSNTRFGWWYKNVGYKAYLDESGNFVAVGEVTAYSSSDIRLKKNLKELKAINTLRKINTFEYDWTEEALQLKANKNVHDYGIIAQELESIIPEAVTHDMYGKGYLGIDYTKLIPFTISAIKEVDDEVTTLKKRVKELEDRLSKYESSVK